MPKSKHRRNGKNRPRPQKQAIAQEIAHQRNTPSPAWVPVTGATLLIVGVVIILLGYLEPVARFTGGWPMLGQNWPLVGGFLMLTAGFGFLTRWR